MGHWQGPFAAVHSLSHRPTHCTHPPPSHRLLSQAPSKAATATEQKDARGGVDKATTRTGGAAVGTVAYWAPGLFDDELGTAAYWAPGLFDDEHSNSYATDV